MEIRNLFWPLLVSVCGLAALPSSVRGGDRDRLREIVQEQCVPHWVTAHDPAPCISVSQRASAQGYAVLADRKGGAHFLLIPTQRISGIESPELRATGALNYFDAAWNARNVLDAVVGAPVPREAVGLAVNHIHARSQDQLHIHISCLGRSVHDELHTAADRIGHAWSSVRVGGIDYQALRITGRQLGSANPFKLLADRLPGARQAMGQFTVLVAGMEFKEGPGFVVLAGYAVPGAELLLDSSCAVVQRPVQNGETGGPGDAGGRLGR
jgi:CDP-diacylglycerol pyrophosphatase